MTRTMYDGINSLAAGIHERFPNAAMVAGYIDGRFVWTQAEWNLFPNAVKVKIAVFSSTNGGDVIDCETGDATPAEAAAWVRMRHAAGYFRPTIYCSRSVIPAVRQATGNLILNRDYDIWCADYTGSPHQVTSSVAGGVTAACAATQYLNTAAYDASIVYDNGWPHSSAPGTTTAPPTWPAGVTLQVGSNGMAVQALQYAYRDSGIPGVRGISVDGAFGTQTQTATRNFEAAEHLTVDSGIAGTQVRTALIRIGRLTTAGAAIG